MRPENAAINRTPYRAEGGAPNSSKAPAWTQGSDGVWFICHGLMPAKSGALSPPVRYARLMTGAGWLATFFLKEEQAETRMNLSSLGLDLLVLAQPRWLMLSLLLLLAALIDAWQWRIPNALTFGGCLAALASSLLEPGSAAQAVLTVLAGLLVGLLLMMPLYLMRALGAGDVKLMGMVGAFLGAPHAVGAALLVFISGGVLALLVAIYRHGWQPLWARLLPLGQRSDSLGRMPYGASIGLGTVIYLCAFVPAAPTGLAGLGV